LLLGLDVYEREKREKREKRERREREEREKRERTSVGLKWILVWLKVKGSKHGKTQSERAV
jgi:hypothetical protein